MKAELEEVLESFRWHVNGCDVEVRNVVLSIS